MCETRLTGDLQNSTIGVFLSSCAFSGSSARYATVFCDKRNLDIFGSHPASNSILADIFVRLGIKGKAQGAITNCHFHAQDQIKLIITELTRN